MEKGLLWSMYKRLAFLCNRFRALNFQQHKFGFDLLPTPTLCDHGPIYRFFNQLYALNAQ